MNYDKWSWAKWLFFGAGIAGVSFLLLGCEEASRMHHARNCALSVKSMCKYAGEHNVDCVNKNYARCLEHGESESESVQVTE